jgi:hypothetical protein
MIFDDILLPRLSVYCNGAIEDGREVLKVNMVYCMDETNVAEGNLSFG